MLHSMDALWQNMKQGASMCPVRHGKAVLMQEVCRPDHMTNEVPVAFTAHEAMMDSRVQKSTQLSDSA